MTVMSIVALSTPKEESLIDRDMQSVCLGLTDPPDDQQKLGVAYSSSGLAGKQCAAHSCAVCFQKALQAFSSEA